MNFTKRKEAEPTGRLKNTGGHKIEEEKPTAAAAIILNINDVSMSRGGERGTSEKQGRLGREQEAEHHVEKRL